jgi:hypothetical protein
LGYRPSSFEKEFLSAPIHSPLSSHQFGPSGLRRFNKKPPGYLVEPQNQDWRLGGWRRDLDASRSSDAGGHAMGSQGLHQEDADCGNGVIAR